jgi:hypothetical protein
MNDTTGTRMYAATDKWAADDQADQPSLATQIALLAVRLTTLEAAIRDLTTPVETEPEWEESREVSTNAKGDLQWRYKLKGFNKSAIEIDARTVMIAEQMATHFGQGNMINPVGEGG